MDLLYNPDASYFNPPVSTNENKWLKFLTKCCPMPQRYVLTLMGFFGLVMAYSMRLSLSVAITQMVTPPIINTTNIAMTYAEPITICPYQDENYIHEHFDYPAIFDSLYNSNNDNVYHWSQEQQGIILSSFFWGYLITQIPGGMLSQRYGGKYVFMLGILFSAVCSILTPNVVQLADANGLIGLRILSGLGEGTMYAGLTDLLAAWVPLKERTTLGSLAYGGSTVGTIGGTYLAALIIHKYKSWHEVFYFFGSLTIGWCFLFLLLCYNGPEHHPFITVDEKKYLLDELGQHHHQQQQPHDTTNGTKRKLPKQTPWRQILTSVPFIALILCQVSHEWAFCVIVLDLPKYMNDVLHFSIQDNGIYSSIPQVIKLIMALVTGVLSDYLISTGRLTITNGRKFFVAFASIFTGIFIVAASYAECDKIYVVAYFTISVAFQGVPGVAINSLDLSPNYAGILMGIGGAVTSITGILVPYLVGIFTPNAVLIEWRIVFWITFILQLIKLVIFSIFGSGDVQPWDSYATDPSRFNRNKSEFSFMSDIQTGSGYEEDDEEEEEEDDSDLERLLW